MKYKFKIGDMVQSIYRKYWHGVIISMEESKYKNKSYTIYEVQQLLTVDGREQRIKRVVKLSECWLKRSNIEKLY